MGRLKAESKAESDVACRRPGRFRRWVLRPLFWGLAALVLLVFVLQQLLNTRWARDSARDLIVEQLTVALGREVTLADLTFELLPLSVEIWGLTVAGPEPDNPLFLELPFVSIEADLSALQQRRLHLQEVRIERPVVFLEYYPGGTNNLIKRRRDGPRRRGSRQFDVFIDRVEIIKADFGLDQQTVRLSIAADSVRTQLDGIGELHLGGQLDAQDVVIRLPNATQPVTVAVSARGTLRRGAVDIESTRISGPDIRITGSGQCEFSQSTDSPDREIREQKKCLFQVRGDTRGQLLADLGYFQDLRGAIDFDGTYSWRPFLSGWRSRVNAPQIFAWERQIDDFRGSVVADRYGMRIGVDQANYAAGQLSGNIAWESKEEGRPWTVDMAFRGLEFDHVLADQQVASSGYASRVNGKLNYRFLSQQSGRGDGSAELELVEDPTRPGLPLTGAFPARITGGIVRTDSISTRSEHQSVLAAGRYDLETRVGTYDFEITSADLPELIPVLPFDAGAEPPLWLPTAGRGELTGTLYLAPDQVATDLRVRLEEFVSPGVSAGFVSGGMHLTQEAAESLRLELGDGDQALLMHGEMPYRPDAERPTKLTLEAFEWPAAAAHPWLDFELPVDGKLSGHLELRVDDVASYGDLDARVAPAQLLISATAPAVDVRTSDGVAGPPGDSQPTPALLGLGDVDLDALETRLRWDADGVIFEHLELTSPSGVMEITGTHEWTTGALDLELDSEALKLSEAPLAQYLPRDDIHGEVSIVGQLGGALHDPRLEMVIEADSLALGQRILAGRSSRLQVSWDDGQFATEGRLLDMVSLSGGGALLPDAADLAFRLDGNDLKGLAELMLEEPPTDLGGRFVGDLAIRSKDEQVTVDLELETLEIDVVGRQLQSLAPVRARLEAEHLTVDSLHLGEAATGSEFQLTGTLGYVTPTSLDLQLDSTLSCDWLALLGLGLDISGTLDVQGTLGGTFEQPTFEGLGQLADANVVLSEDFPLEIQNLEGRVSFHPGHAVLDHLEGTLGGGQVVVLGEATLPTPEQPMIYRLQLTGSEMDLRYLEGWSVRGDSQISLASTDGGHLLDGRIELTALEFADDIRTDFEQLMRGFLQRQRLEVEPTDSVLSTIELNLDIDAPGAVRVRNNLADFEGSAQLLVRGNMAQPVLYGEVELDPDGTLRYNSTDYTIERGRIVFTNPYELDPEIDLVAVTRVREFDVTLAVDGTFERLESRFSSEPPLPDLEVFRLLASGGDETTDTTLMASQRTEVEADASTSAATFLYGQAASVIGQRVNQLFGFDKFRIDPLTGSGDQLSKARVTVGKRLSKDVFVTFSADPSSTEDQRLRIEWQVSPSLSLILTQNGDESYSADARWESSF